jgi:hypothetical protein
MAAAASLWYDLCAYECMYQCVIIVRYAARCVCVTDFNRKMCASDITKMQIGMLAKAWNIFLVGLGLYVLGTGSLYCFAGIRG